MKLLTIGDSISQGFMSGAAARTDLSFSTIIAEQLSIKDYKYPLWPMHGLPVNIEDVFRMLDEKYGPNINTFEWLMAGPFSIPSIINESEEYYERGQGNEESQYDDKTEYFHNISVRGFTVSDAWLLKPSDCLKAIKSDSSSTKDNLYAAANKSLYRTALKVLNPSLENTHMDKSQLGWLEYHVKNEGVENVLLWLGANNALGTILDLNIKYTDCNIKKYNHFELIEKGWNLWHPEDFATDYELLLDKIDKILDKQDTKVFLGTVPLVTIAPLAKGVGEIFEVKIIDDDGNEKLVNYFKNYTYFPFDGDFAFNSGINLSFSQVYHIDNCIRQYNKDIKRLATKFNERNNSRYHIVDTCNVLNQLAYKRNNGLPTYTFPSFFDYQYPRPDTKYYHADTDGNLKQGGLFSLDGVHPTAIAHGILAYEFLKVMKSSGIKNADSDKLDWSKIIQSDSLYQKPIKVMHEIYQNANLAELVMNLLKKIRRDQPKDIAK